MIEDGAQFGQSAALDRRHDDARRVAQPGLRQLLSGLFEDSCGGASGARSARVITIRPCRIPNAASASRWSLDCSCHPSSAATTKQTTGAGPSPASVLPRKRWWPGTSTKATCRPDAKVVQAKPRSMVSPRRRSSSQPVGFHAGEGADQGALAVVDVAGGGDDVRAQRIVQPPNAARRRPASARRRTPVCSAGRAGTRRRAPAATRRGHRRAAGRPRLREGAPPIRAVARRGRPRRQPGRRARRRTRPPRRRGARPGRAAGRRRRAAPGSRAKRRRAASPRARRG